MVSKPSRLYVRNGWESQLFGSDDRGTAASGEEEAPSAGIEMDGLRLRNTGDGLASGSLV